MVYYKLYLRTRSGDRELDKIKFNDFGIAVLSALTHRNHLRKYQAFSCILVLSVKEGEKPALRAVISVRGNLGLNELKS